MNLRRFCVIAPFVAMALFAALPASAQDSGLKVEVVSLADAGFPNARAVVSTEDTSASASPQLTAENFGVTLDGKPAPIVSVELATSEAAPLDLLFVIDTSGSMEGAPIASAKDAAKALLADLGASDRVAIISFGDEVTQVLDFTADRAQAAAAIDSLVAQGNTALYQATTVGAFKIATSQAPRRAVILLSDGADFGGRSVATREEAISGAASAAVPFFTIAQGSDLDRAYLQQVAQVTRGRFLEAPNPADLKDLYVSIGRLLRSQYVVTFDASAVATSPQADLVITVTDGDRSASDDAVYQPGAGFAPTVTISGIEPGESLSERREVLVTVPGGGAITSIAWYVDGVNVAESKESPFTFSFDPSKFGDGEHTLRAAVAAGAATVESSVAFSSAPPAASGGGGLPLIPTALAVLALLGAGGVVVIFRLRRMERGGPTTISADQRLIPIAQHVRRNVDGEPPADFEEPEVAPEVIGEPMGVLISRSGPDLGAEYAVGGSPVGIGSGARCGVRVKDPELGLEEARIWVRGGHLMVHKMTRLAALASDGTTGGWAILDPGDTFQIGQHAFEFRLLPAGEQTLSEPEEITNILRDPDIPRPDTRRALPDEL